MMISVQTEDFNCGDEYRALREASPSAGAIVTFVGLVRDFTEHGDLITMTLEHYPGMTETSLNNIVRQAQQRWEIHRVKVIHRIGELKPQEQIVFVGVSSAHRQNAFDACEFIMDYLKTQAPFWKKEKTASGERWVKFKASDQARAADWEKK